MAANAETRRRRQVAVTIDAALADRLDAEAEERMVGKAFLVERALRQFFATIPPADGVVDIEILDG